MGTFSESRERIDGRDFRFVGFGMTKRPGVSVSNDPGIAALLQAETDAVCYVAKAWDYHVKVALGATNQENVESIRQSVPGIHRYQ